MHRYFQFHLVATYGCKKVFLFYSVQWQQQHVFMIQSTHSQRDSSAYKFDFLLKRTERQNKS